jgi:hypothetical protein
MPSLPEGCSNMELAFHSLSRPHLTPIPSTPFVALPFALLS